MRIDYSTESTSKYVLFMDVPILQSINHLELAIKGDNYGLSVSERIKHLAIGILKYTPIFGHLFTLIDTLNQKKSVVHVKLTSTDPFKRGEEHGRLLKNQIKVVYDPILKMRCQDPTVRTRAIEFERQIPDYLKQELKGLAKGSGYSYEDVVLIHTFLDADPGKMGCTTMAVRYVGLQDQRIAAANHAMGETCGPSESRFYAILDARVPENGSPEKVLKAAEVDSTIQAIAFDLLKGEIKISSRESFAASGNFTTFGPDTLFKSHNFTNKDSKYQMRVFRNLDWPWYFLGQETVILTRPRPNGDSTVSITWPGYIGTLSGINNRGLCLAQNSRGEAVDLTGIPNPLLFTNLLDCCSTVDVASKYLNWHGSSLNLIMADKETAKSFELQGNQTVKCVGDLGKLSDFIWW